MITKDDFCDMLNEGVAVVLFGVEFRQGDIIRQMDPIMFDVMYNDYLQAVEEAEEEEYEYVLVNSDGEEIPRV